MYIYKRNIETSRSKLWTFRLKNLKKKFIDEVINKVQILVEEKNFERALSLIESLAHDLEGLVAKGICRDDSTSEYRCFSNLFEMMLYIEQRKPRRELRIPYYPIGFVFLTYGSILIDLKDLERARTALDKAIFWAPTDATYVFEYAETFKVEGNMDEYLKSTMRAYDIIYSPLCLARFYRNLGYYFIERKLWNEAIACYGISLSYEPESPKAFQELNYIVQETGKAIEWPSREDAEKICEENHIPYGPSKNVINVAMSYGMSHIKENDPETAKYFLEIAYSLVKDPRIKVTIDSLKLPKDNPSGTIVN